MSDKVKSIDQLEVVKPSKLSPKPAKHTNCQSIPSTLMSFGYNQAAAAAASNCNATHTEGKHHHHHHHHHGHNHHQPHVIYRTTSESLRIGSDLNHAESTHSLSNSTSMSSSGTSSSGGNQQLLLSMTRKPKTSSFQITSVTVGNKLSADNGDDSADDLDESHTDDNSRITDMENETPSFSEDTFSKEDVFFSNSALGTAPVIPTSSQYGLVIVDPDLGGVGGQSGQNLSNVHVSMADAGINIVGAPSSKLGDSDQKDMLHRNERFKVVKIESTEPFKRGRWMCMDYLDHSTLGSDAAANASTNNAQSSGQGGVTNDSGVVILENNSEVSCEPSETGSLYNAGISSIISSNNHSPGQTLQKPLGEQQSQSLVNNIVNVPSGMIPHSTASMSHQVSVSASQANMVCPPYTQPNQMHQSLPPQQQYQQPASHMPGQSQPAHFYQNNQPNPSAVPTMHGVTLPSNINMQNGVPTNFVPQQQQQVQQQPQPQQPPQQVTAPQSMPAVNIAMNAPTNCTDQNNVNIVTSMPPTSNMVQATSISQPASMAQVIPQTQQQPECYLPQSSQSYAGPGMPVTSSASGGIPMDIHHPDMSAAVQQQQQQHQQLLSQQQPQQQAQSLPAQQHQQQQPPPVVGSMSVAANATPQNISPAGVETMMQQQPQPTNQSPLQNMAIGQDGVVQQSIATVVNDGSSTVSTPQQAQASSATGTQQQATAIGNEEDQAAALEADSESASGTSAVAIDNKIEQAMDLVKSHLMIAVREEVEVLKEKIAELMDRINQLELENTILKANVSQETLSQLSATMQSAAAKPPTNQNTSNGPIS